MKKYSIDYVVQNYENLVYPSNYYKPIKLYVRLVGVNINDLKKLSTLYTYGQNVKPFTGAIPAYKNIIKSTDAGILWTLYGNGTVTTLVNKLKNILKSCWRSYHIMIY